MTPGTELNQLIDDYLDSRHIFHWRNNTGRRGYVQFGKIGSGDFLGVLPGGRFLSIETKRKDEKETPKQIEFREDVNFNGGLAFVARSVEDVVLIFHQEGI